MKYASFAERRASKVRCRISVKLVMEMKLILEAYAARVWKGQMHQRIQPTCAITPTSNPPPEIPPAKKLLEFTKLDSSADREIPTLA